MPIYSQYPQYYPTQYNVAPPQPTQPPVPQIQIGDFVPVPNEEYARNYPVALGRSVSFKDESNPMIYYSKTMGVSQFDQPIFKRYRLIEEESLPPTQPQETNPEPKEEYASIAMINDIKAEIAALQDEVNAIKEPKKQTNSRRKDDGGD